jgi:4-amino-4-deoxy-L-arabinose transferase-like glycosyltransferase
VFGRTNVSGLKFFFGIASLAVFSTPVLLPGTAIKTFFLHTTLWAFLPWSILLYVAVISLLKNRKTTGGIKWIIYGSGAVTFLLFSFSGFQLPHYIVILFPHFALITAGYISTFKNERTIRNAVILQNTY